MSPDTERTIRVLAILLRSEVPMSVRDINRALPRTLRTHVRTLQRDLAALRKWTWRAPQPFQMQLRVISDHKPYLWYANELPPY